MMRKSEKFGREFRVISFPVASELYSFLQPEERYRSYHTDATGFDIISRWEPTSQVCSDCGYKWGKLDLKVRSVQCLNCGVEHDRDENAAKNINKVGIGHCRDSKRRQRGRKTTSVADPCEASRITALLGR
jgi:hypothetical protein